ncbi:MAG: hypothetical protein IKS66_06905 [Oscillospiraceae bacterium]|nr:hypothetical protein [Oscillospiraceae bacterium]
MDAKPDTTGFAVDRKLTKTIQWTLYIVIVAVLVVGFFVPFCLLIFSDNPPDKLSDWMTYAGIGLSIFSVILAFYSLYMSSESQKRLEKSLENVIHIQQESDTILHEVRTIVTIVQSSQDRIETNLSTMRNFSDSTVGTVLAAWAKDKTGPNA